MRGRREAAKHVTLASKSKSKVLREGKHVEESGVTRSQANQSANHVVSWNWRGILISDVSATLSACVCDLGSGSAQRRTSSARSWKVVNTRIHNATATDQN